jgi:4'-phosphopantetheinyl transferase
MILPDVRIWRIDAAGKDEAHRALDAILECVTGRPPVLARAEHGKPYLENAPQIKFNMARTKGKALVAVTTAAEIGVDIERLRPIPDFEQIAERFLPPGDADSLADLPQPDREREFFRLWTRAEALWKAAGVGLYGAGKVIDGQWHVEDIDAGEGFTAAVACAGSPREIIITDFGADE